MYKIKTNKERGSKKDDFSMGRRSEQGSLSVKARQKAKAYISNTFFHANEKREQ